MKNNSFNSVYSQANILYGTTLDTTNFEDICLSGWELIGNRQTALYKYTTNTEDKKIKLPCNVDMIEVVVAPNVEAQTSSNIMVYPNIYNQWIEGYIESWKKNKNVFYDKGMMLKYRQEGENLVFDRDYNNVTIIYHGVIVDDDGLPYLNDKEVAALAAYCTYMDIYKQSLIRRDGGLFQLATAAKNDWLRLCNSARIPKHLDQNLMNDILDVKTRWDRKMYGKSFHPVL